MTNGHFITCQIDKRFVHWTINNSSHLSKCLKFNIVHMTFYSICVIITWPFWKNMSFQMKTHVLTTLACHVKCHMNTFFSIFMILPWKKKKTSILNTNSRLFHHRIWKALKLCSKQFETWESQWNRTFHLHHNTCCVSQLNIASHKWRSYIWRFLGFEHIEY